MHDSGRPQEYDVSAGCGPGPGGDADGLDALSATPRGPLRPVPPERLATTIRARLGSGRGAAVALTGGPGTGKSYMLETIATVCRDLAAVHRVCGARSEARWGLAVAHRLAAELAQPPATDATAREHGGPAAELEVEVVVEGEVERSTLDAFVRLVSTRAVRHPVVCLLDDADWVDEPSRQVLSYAARRVGRLPVALVVAGRDLRPDAFEGFEGFEGFDTVAPAALDAATTREVLRVRGGTDVDDVVAAAVARTCGGLPGAVADVADALAGGHLGPEALLHRPLPLSRDLCAAVLSPYGALSAEAWRWLLVAACAPDLGLRDVDLAARAVGVGERAYLEAEAAGVISLTPTVRFCDPVLAPVVRALAPAPEVRRVHAVLATSPGVRRDRVARAGHLACSTVAPTDEVADEIWAIAEAFPAPMTFLDRAGLMLRSAELSSDRDRRLDRRRRAGREALLAGAPVLAENLLADNQLADNPLADNLVADTLDAVPASGHTPALASPWTVLNDLCFPDSRHTSTGNGPIAGASTEWRDGSCAAELAGALLLAATDGVRAASPALSAAVARTLGLVDRDRGLDGDLAVLTPYAARAALLTWDAPAAQALLGAGRSVARARRGAGLSCALDAVADVLSHALDAQPHAGHELDGTDTPHGDVAVTLHGTRAGASTAAGRRVAGLLADGAHAEALELLLSFTHRSLDAPGDVERPVSPVPHVAPPVWWAVRGGHHLPDLVEAAVHVGERRLAEEALTELEDLASHVGSPWADGVLARSRALVAADDAATHFDRAIDLLSSLDAVGAVGRTRLLYGEWLRRNRRRAAAAHQLAAASSLLAQVQHPLRVRADRGLALVGGDVRTTRFAVLPHHPGPLHAAQHLTQQEYAVARLAAGGARNTEIAEQLVVSRHTVDYHLRKVYRKLDIADRRALARLLQGREVAEPPRLSRDA